MSIELSLRDNKRYESIKIRESLDIFSGYYEDNVIDNSLLKKIARDLGFSYDTYLFFCRVDHASASSLIVNMSAQNRHEEILLLVDEDMKEVVGYSLEVERYPILNNDFFKRVLSMVESQDHIIIDEYHYHPNDITSSILLKRKEPIVIEEKYEDKPSNYVKYDVGILLFNDETTSAYSRLVVYINNQPLYLPASYYSTSTNRYRRSTSNSIEALELLMLKCVDDLREDALYEKVKEVHYKYNSIKNIVVSYEEYSNLLKAMRKIPSIIEDQSFLDSLSSRYEKFEEKYPQLDDKKSSYIWRCTAFSNLDVSTLISITSSILSEVRAPVCEYFNVREILGSYVSTNRIVQEIASGSFDY